MLPRQQLCFNRKGNLMLIQGLGSNKITCLGATCTVRTQKKDFVNSFLAEPKNAQDELLFIEVSTFNSNGRQTSYGSFHLIHITWDDEGPFVDNMLNFITGKTNRSWSIDSNGFLYAYTSDKIFTNNPATEDAYFISDVDIILKYIIDQIDKKDLLTGANKTAKKIALAKEYADLQKEVEKLRNIKATYASLCESAVQVTTQDSAEALLIPGNPISNLTVNYVNLFNRHNSFFALLEDTIKQLKDPANDNYHQVESISQAIGTSSVNNRSEVALSEIIRLYAVIVKERDVWKKLAHNLCSAIKMPWLEFRFPGTKCRAIKAAANAIPKKE